MSDSKRFATLVLAAGAVVLLAAIVLGEVMGNHVFTKIVRGRSAGVAPLSVTPEPSASAGPFGPNWKRSEALTSVPAPAFPDPRVPPKPLPTRAPMPTPSPPPAGPTLNPNVPIWRQQPLPTVAPSMPSLPSAAVQSTAAAPSTAAAVEPSASP